MEGVLVSLRGPLTYHFLVNLKRACVLAYFDDLSQNGNKPNYSIFKFIAYPMLLRHPSLEV